jgi:hypothetical protein
MTLRGANQRGHLLVFEAPVRERNAVSIGRSGQMLCRFVLP